MKTFIFMILGFSVSLASKSQITLPPDLPQCPDYSAHSQAQHEPRSTGRYKLSYQRPDPACRTFTLPEVEDTILSMKSIISDPDLFRLFENCFPNTLDTAITWKGTANDSSNEELTFITTGDIQAMWLRDSAHQLISYSSLLRPSTSPDSLASLFRGAINLQARYILTAPHCNAFNPPIESGISFPPSSSAFSDYVHPPIPYSTANNSRVNTSPVYECKYELDSLASFLYLSHTYYSRTNDSAFFAGEHGTRWWKAVETTLDLADELKGGTYNGDGSVAWSAYQFQRQTSTATETLMNGGFGSPVKGGTGMVRSAFRPSDDATILQLSVAGNMMFGRGLEMGKGVVDRGLVKERIQKMAAGIREGIERYGRFDHWKFGRVYGYEVDGFGGVIAMDDANIPSLLSAPLLGYVDRDDLVYQNTRRFVLSEYNPYFMYGPALNGTGGPHIGPGMAWPMSLIVRIMTSDDDREIASSLKQILSSTAGYGLIHESVNTHDSSVWTRHWFSWANGLFGQMMLDLKERKPHLLAVSHQ
ncbi:hypothetical protein QBC44DRAFT_285769 [Cladorrhinum sp. PSN332]|nr:hypothetical protein QBC44DRAFT_285769 [Cladorrhinum sp. PSN332]